MFCCQSWPRMDIQALLSFGERTFMPTGVAAMKASVSMFTSETQLMSPLLRPVLTGAFGIWSEPGVVVHFLYPSAAVAVATPSHWVPRMMSPFELKAMDWIWLEGRPLARV